MRDVANSEESALPTILVVNFRSAQLVAGLLSELSSTFRVVVVNNDQSAAEIEQLDCLGVPAIQSPRNGGFAAGVNLAVDMAPPGWLLLLNPDVRAARNLVMDFCARGQASGFDLLCPTILGLHGKVWYGGGRLDRRLLAVRHESFGRDFVPGVLQETELVTGCAVLVSPKARATVFPLREDLFMYWEDVQLSLDAHAAGMRAAVDGSLAIHHDEGASSRRGDEGRSILFHYYQARNRIIVLTDNGVAGRLHLFASTVAYTIQASAGILRRDARPLRKIASLLKGALVGASISARRRRESPVQ